jgi:glycosyltransferase involved in cell wall biosynthesis
MFTKADFDAQLRESLAAVLNAGVARGDTPALDATGRWELAQHAGLVGWEAPQRLLQMRDAAARAVRGDAGSFAAMAQLGQWCWHHADAAENVLIRDALKAAVLDRSAMDAVQAVAAGMPHAARACAGTAGGRVAFVISSLVPGAATTYVIRALAPDLMALGWQVALYPTWPHDNCDAAIRDELSRAGVRIHAAPDGADPIRTASWMAEHLRSNPVDAIVHYVWPHDYVSKLLCNLRCATLQVFVNHTCDQPTGDFDLKIGYAGDYQGHHQAERYVTMPNCSVRAAQARRVPPFERAQLGLAADAVCLATFSRLAKCVDIVFVDAMCRILSANPQAIWLLVGGRDPASEGQINASLARAGVAGQVLYAGFMQGDAYFSLLRAVDIYCDTITWMGGQTVADAVACGLPVVCCAAGQATALAPHGNNPTVLASRLLGAGSRVANAGDAQDYARLAQAYIDDLTLRECAGRLNAESVDDDAWPEYVRKFEFLLRCGLQHKQQQAVPAAGSGTACTRQAAALV